MSKRRIGVLGLGYVGLMTAIALSPLGKLVAFDIDKKRIEELKEGFDRNNEIPKKENISSSKILWTSNINDLKDCDFYIISVPTPITLHKQPDMSMVLSASELVGKILKKNDIVVYESSVYPGATEERCIPVLEKVSGLRCNKDFSVGFSPERINPADQEHTFYNIVKIIAATNPETVECMADIYSNVIKAGVFRAKNIRVAEAAKIVENTQRDINIAFLNDITILLFDIGINIHDVIEAMSTKWNSLPFRPGLVGGHCIGVNSYYLLYKADEVGYHSDLIHSSRRINEVIARFIARESVKKLIHLNVPIKRSRVAVMGFTYKENCSDLRNTRVIDIINELKSVDVEVLINDPIADPKAAKKYYDLELVDWNEINDLDAIIFAVSHQEYKNISANDLNKMLNNRGLIVDVVNILNYEEIEKAGMNLWRL